MPWLIDTDILIEGERGNPAFKHWLANADEIATADIVRGEFLLGVRAVPMQACGSAARNSMQTELLISRPWPPNLRIMRRPPLSLAKHAASERASRASSMA